MQTMDAQGQEVDAQIDDVIKLVEDFSRLHWLLRTPPFQLMYFYCLLWLYNIMCTAFNHFSTLIN